MPRRSRLEGYQRGAEVAAGIIGMTLDEWVLPEDLVYTRPLHTHAAAVDDAEVAQTECVRFMQVGVDHVGNVAWCERMQVELRTDRDDVGVIH
jgi:hypothetical protein